MRNVGAILLSLIGLVAVIFNRFAVEEAYRAIPRDRSKWGLWSIIPVWLARTVVIVSGLFFVIFGLSQTDFLR